MSFQLLAERDEGRKGEGSGKADGGREEAKSDLGVKRIAVAPACGWAEQERQIRNRRQAGMAESLRRVI